MAETKKEANAAFDLFVETYGVKYEKAVAKLVKDRAELLAFYDFPAEHWKHIRTTNPIESVFATVRNRTRKTKGCLNRKTALAMVFRLMMSAKKKWRKISGPNRLPVTSPTVVRLFLEQLWFKFVPVFHRLQGRLAAQGGLRQLLVIKPDVAVQRGLQLFTGSEVVAL